MRWARLFADLEAQFDQAERTQLQSEVADRIRRERAAIRLLDRFRASVGRPVRAYVLGGTMADGTVRFVGSDWILLEGNRGNEAVIPLHALSTVLELDDRASAPGSEGVVASRLNMGYVLRGLARDRAGLTVMLLDASVLSGTIDRVYADCFDLAQHAPDELRRPAAVRGHAVIPFDAVAMISRATA